MFFKRVSFGSKDCTKELKLECAYSLGQTSYFLPFIGSLIYLFTILDDTFLTAVRHEVNNLESSVVLQELELAINLALYVFMELWFSLSYKFSLSYMVST